MRPGAVWSLEAPTDQVFRASYGALRSREDPLVDGFVSRPRSYSFSGDGFSAEHWPIAQLSLRFDHAVVKAVTAGISISARRQGWFS